MKTYPSRLNLADVVINPELARRLSRPPDYELENCALIALAETMADRPETILQKLVETALRLCRAGTAGISLLEKHGGEEVFRWEAVAGVYADHVNGTMPRDASPCGITIDRNATQLMYMAERVFPALPAEPPFVEALLVPFHFEHKPVGTVWVVAHDQIRKFDSEDARLINILAQFASSAWQVWQARAAAEAGVRAERQRAVESAAANEALQLQIGEREHAENDLKKLNDELERRVTERTRELILTIENLTQTIEERERLQGQLQQSQKMESIGTLAAGLAHDFNNLLNVIQGYAMTLTDDPSDREKVVHTGQSMAETVAQGAVLARQLLTLARKSDAKLEPTDLNGLLGKLKNLLVETFPKTITVEMDLAAGLPDILGDGNRINQVLLNLCVNARDAMPNGGKLVLRSRTISGAELRAGFPDAQSERYACVSVADTGVGMSEDVRSRIFEPFFTTKESGQGTGLGLSVSHGIVAQQNGFIDVVSQPGLGSTFRIYLSVPKDRPALADALVEKKISARSGFSETLLFVEDEAQQLALMQKFLERRGFTVLTAMDGAEAVEVHRRHKDKIVVVILDLGLAKLNGWEAFQRMRKINPNIKGILASGYISPEVEAHVANRALSGVVMKPYQPGEVLAKIEGAIRSA